ncbi:MAG: metallophosphoesterase [Fimbriimonadaceae bacterium]|nr:metallophosphoesterase [Fimbriimonadaceae bacterium]QYK55376.1 MAG: metallophosphoesterase [Fimbriimonadaceae bacterium]
MSLTRRELLAAGAVASLAPLAFGRQEQTDIARLKPFRVVHFTDVHVQPEMNAPWGMAKALRHALSQDPKPDMVVTGGDLVMDAFAATEERAKTQWAIFSSVMKDCDVPVVHTLGNHDVWGWNKKASKTTGDEPLWGKRWFMETFEYANTYQALEAGDWRLVVLDTLIMTDDGYNGYLDEAQLDWFKGEIAKSEKPMMVVSHIPLIAPCNMVHGYKPSQGEWVVGGSLQTKNFDDVRKVFDANPQVKLCVSGHIHLVDRYDYNGVSYVCAGAVSGAWWMGKSRTFDPGYTVFDLYPDGRWEHSYVSWGWNSDGKG